MSNETQPAHNGFHLREAIEALGGNLRDWTVMGEGSDPFRMDTPVNHRDGEWLGDTLARLGVTQRLCTQRARAGRPPLPPPRRAAALAFFD